MIVEFIIYCLFPSRKFINFIYYNNTYFFVEMYSYSTQYIKPSSPNEEKNQNKDYNVDVN
jgi:hypothetical protein